MKQVLSFDDVLIVPSFSSIKSRKDVSVKTSFLGENLFPIVSSNMASVTEYKMALEMQDQGAKGCLHRFMSIGDNIKEYIKSPKETYCSIGLGKLEIERAQSLVNVGCKTIVIDVAHGATIETVKQFKELRYLFRNNINIIVGNFATKRSIDDFKSFIGDYKVDAWKVGIGGGSACTTRKISGCGLPTLASIIDCSRVEEPIIADGGIRGSDDFVKALAAGAKMVMLGGMLAGTDEAASTLNVGYSGKLTHCETLDKKLILLPTEIGGTYCRVTKTYSGSASSESYVAQGKEAEHRTPEGETFEVAYTGSVESVLQKLEAGLRSAMAYTGSNTLEEFKERAELVQITHSGKKESRAHGRL